MNGMPNGIPNELGYVEETAAPAPTAFQRLQKTCFALGVLLVTAGMFSYLLAYAMTDALATAQVLPRYQSDNDPRPMWMVRAFVCLTCTFMAVGGLARLLSRRQLRRIDAMADEEPVAKTGSMNRPAIS
jgi:TRAP-type mannitol/chloroaromatic compound transport system permease small subunit